MNTQCYLGGKYENSSNENGNCDWVSYMFSHIAVSADCLVMYDAAQFP